MQNQHKKNADKPINSTNTNAHTTQKNTLKYAQFNQLNKPHKCRTHTYTNTRF